MLLTVVGWWVVCLMAVSFSKGLRDKGIEHTSAPICTGFSFFFFQRSAGAQSFAAVLNLRSRRSWPRSRGIAGLCGMQQAGIALRSR